MQILFDYFSRVAGYDIWVVAIELLLIGLVVYWAVDFLEGTRGERLFRGIIFVLIAGVLSLGILRLVVARVKLERLEFLYGGFVIAVLVIAVAAFQPEIRRALIRIGKAGFMQSASERRFKTAEEIINAVTKLSASRIGAIIVLENRVALGEFIETGISLNAEVRSELLRTIFEPGTPLHDMAVVVREDQIVAARVQLPLADASTIDGVDLGSRHRAAIGITSGSDASVIVVSEETGIVSIAEGGKLARNVTEAQLRKHLVGSGGESERISHRFWKVPKRKAAAGS